MRAVLLPDSPSNLKTAITRQIREGIAGSVSEHFKKYYMQVKKKEQQLLSECGTIVLEQGGIERNI